MKVAEQILLELKLLQAKVAATTEPPKKWLSVLEAAAYLGIGKTKMYELLSERELNYSTIGDKMLIKVDELERYMKFQEVPAKARKSR